MTTPTATTDVLHPGPALAVGGRLLDALARRNFDIVRDCLAPQVRFRALVPPGHIEERTAEATVAHLHRWFGSAERFAVIDAAVGRTGPLVYLRWLVQVVDSSGRSREVEQHAYARVEDRIVALDLLCSGFHEVACDVR